MARSTALRVPGRAQPPRPGTRPARTGTVNLAPIEWIVVELARRDRLSSLRPMSRRAQWMARLFGLEAATRLADPRLESVRRVAVHGWQGSGRIPDEEVDRFLAAGFSFDQMMLILTTLRARVAAEG